MPASNLSYSLSLKTLASGKDAISGKGDTWRIALGGPYAANDTLALNIASSGRLSVLGAGDTLGEESLFALTLNKRIYYVNDQDLAFSGLGAPTGFESQAVGAGFVTTSDQYAQSTDLQALAPYQGKLAVFSRRDVQIWNIAANAADFVGGQILPNTGTMAPLSVQSLGELDVVYLYDTGFRSLRVRDASNNAYILDIGTPLDLTVQASLLNSTDEEKIKACSVIEPISGRYWCYLSGNIYVLSYFPSSKISAWSIYKPTWQQGYTITITDGLSGGTVKITDTTNNYILSNTPITWQGTAADTANYLAYSIDGATYAAEVIDSTTVHFWPLVYGVADISVVAVGVTVTDVIGFYVTVQPIKFQVRGSLVYFRTQTDAFVFGGEDGTQYDYSTATVETPFHDINSPWTKKSADSLDAALSGTWSLYFGSNQSEGREMDLVYTNDEATFEQGNVNVAGYGTHFRLKAVATEPEASVLSSLILHYQQANEKV